MSGNYALQAAINTALAADTAVKALIGNPVRLYQEAKTNATFPYVVFGDTQDLPDLAECIDGWEIFFALNIYSRAGGFQEAKNIGAAIDAVLHDATFTLTGYRCLIIERDSPTRYVVAPDNMTKHGLLTFRAMVEPTT